MILRGQQGKKDWRKGKGIMEGKRLKTAQRKKKRWEQKIWYKKYWNDVTYYPI